MSKEKSVGVFQLENGNWGYRLVITIDGKRKSLKRTKDENGKVFKSQRAAARGRAEALKTIQYNEMVNKENGPVRKTVKEIYDEYSLCGRKDKAFATIKKQDALWNNHLLHSFGDKYVDEIRVADINDYLAELYNVKDYSYGYTESFLKMFYLLFGQAYSRGYLSTKDYNRLCMNKNSKIKMPKKRSTDVKEIEIYTDKQIAAFDKYFEDKNVKTAEVYFILLMKI